MSHKGKVKLIVAMGAMCLYWTICFYTGVRWPKGTEFHYPAIILTVIGFGLGILYGKLS